MADFATVMMPEETALRARLGRAEKEAMRLHKALRASQKQNDKLSQVVESLTARLTQQENSSEQLTEIKLLKIEAKAIIQERDDLVTRLQAIERSGAAPPGNIWPKADKSAQTDEDGVDGPPAIPQSPPAEIELAAATSFDDSRPVKPLAEQT
eukprot:925684-Rhodomonas_salina.2